MKLLLTGSTGFIGRTILLEALPFYDKVVLPVRNPEKLREQLADEGFEWFPFQVESVQGDSSSWNVEGKFEHVVHAAGTLFAQKREDYFKTNVEGTLRLLRSIEKPKRVVILSSQSAGGEAPPDMPRNENHEDKPLTWYGESKLEMERRVREEFSDWPICFLRPPIVLGPRDAATKPLFEMAKSLIRIKPGFVTKQYSWIAVDDLTSAIRAALQGEATGVFYVASRGYAFDSDLISAAGSSVNKHGMMIPIPHAAVKALSTIISSVPSLSAKIPSLTRDRVKEVFADRMIIDGMRFEETFDWKPKRKLPGVLKATAYWYEHGKVMPEELEAEEDETPKEAAER